LYANTISNNYFQLIPINLQFLNLRQKLIVKKLIGINCKIVSTITQACPRESSGRLSLSQLQASGKQQFLIFVFVRLWFRARKKKTKISKMVLSSSLDGKKLQKSPDFDDFCFCFCPPKGTT
jgi:hypothetical protein